MTGKINFFRAITLLIYGTLLTTVHAHADFESDVKRLLDWAQIEYPNLFPTNEVTVRHNEWLYRYYEETNIYAGVNDNQEVWVLGEPWNGMRYISTLNELLSLVPSDKATADVSSLANSNWRRFCFLVTGSDPQTGENTYQTTDIHFSDSHNEYDIAVSIFNATNSTCSGEPGYVFSATYAYEIGYSLLTLGNFEAKKIDTRLVRESHLGAWDKFVFDIFYWNDERLYFGLDVNNTGLTTESLRPDALDLNKPLLLVE